MSISSVNSNQMMPPPPMGGNSGSSTSSMSEEDSEFLEELLSNYDADSLSEEDAQAIVESLQNAGIAPSQGLEETMSENGFSAKDIGDLAGVGRGGGGGRGGMMPPPPSEEEESSITELLESLMSSDDEDDDETSTTSNSSFDTILDYTGKILSLNDEAKTEVLDILNQYNSDENEYSKEDTQKLVSNSLSQILEEPRNYNSMSLYA